MRSLLEGDDADEQCEKLKSSLLDSFNFAKKLDSDDRQAYDLDPDPLYFTLDLKSHQILEQLLHDRHGPEYLERREFRVFLQTLVQHLEYLKAFSKCVWNMLASTFCNISSIIAG